MAALPLPRGERTASCSSSVRQRRNFSDVPRHLRRQGHPVPTRPWTSRGRQGRPECCPCGQSERRSADFAAWPAPRVCGISTLDHRQRMKMIRCSKPCPRSPASLSGRDDEFAAVVLKGHTGMRWGEIVGLERNFVRPASVRVEWQLYELDSGESVQLLAQGRFLPDHRHAAVAVGLGRRSYRPDRVGTLPVPRAHLHVQRSRSRQRRCPARRRKAGRHRPPRRGLCSNGHAGCRSHGDSLRTGLGIPTRRSWRSSGSRSSSWMSVWGTRTARCGRVTHTSPRG